MSARSRILPHAPLHIFRSSFIVRFVSPGALAGVVRNLLMIYTIPTKLQEDLFVLIMQLWRQTWILIVSLILYLL